MTKILAAVALIGAMSTPVFALTPNVAAGANQAVQTEGGLDYIGHDPDSRIQFELQRDSAADRY
jgi:hypothetical protein